MTTPPKPPAENIKTPPSLDKEQIEADARAKGDGRKGIQSVETGLRVLDVLARGYGPMALRDISRGTGLSASQTHRYLTSLIRQEMVVQDSATGRYALGKMALRVGLSALNSIDWMQMAEDGLRNMVERIELTGMLGIWGEQGPVAIRWRRGRTLIYASVGAGAFFPLLGSATGQVFLAFMPRAVTRPLLERELAQLKAAGRPMSEDDVAQIVENIRRDRYVLLDGHFVPGMHSMSAPIFDFQGQLTAVMTLMGHSADPQVSIDDMRRELLWTTADISERLGFAGHRSGASLRRE